MHAHGLHDLPLPQLPLMSAAISDARKRPGGARQRLRELLAPHVTSDGETSAIEVENEDVLLNGIKLEGGNTDLHLEVAKLREVLDNFIDELLEKNEELGVDNWELQAQNEELKGEIRELHARLERIQEPQDSTVLGSVAHETQGE